jgi:hypothetical protein
MAVLEGNIFYCRVHNSPNIIGFSVFDFRICCISSEFNCEISTQIFHSRYSAVSASDGQFSVQKPALNTSRSQAFVLAENQLDVFYGEEKHEVSAIDVPGSVEIVRRRRPRPRRRGRRRR